MKSLIEKEDELRKLAESGEYEDILELADCLFLQEDMMRRKWNI